MNAADAACYQAKAGGRGRVHVGRLTQTPEPAEAMDWAANIRDGLEQGRLRLRGQWLRPLKGGRRMLEFLVSLELENGEVVGPGTFLPAAERSGLMKSLDRHMLSLALAHAGTLEPNIVACVNLSPQSMEDPDFPAVIAEELDHSRPGGEPPVPGNLRKRGSQASQQRPGLRQCAQDPRLPGLAG